MGSFWIWRKGINIWEIILKYFEFDKKYKFLVLKSLVNFKYKNYEKKKIKLRDNINKLF